MNKKPRPGIPKKTTQDQTLAQLPVKTSHTGAPPLMTKTHYSFAESLRFIKSKFPEFTRENLLNHGFQGDVSFFVKVPIGVEVRSFHASRQENLHEQLPDFLSLHASACEYLERNGIVHLYLFARGYWTSSITQLIEVLPNYQANNAQDAAFQLFKSGFISDIPITIADLLITHIELLLLAERIRLRVEAETSPAQRQIVVQNKSAQLLTKHFQSLQTISSNASDCRPEDLLRHAIQRNLPMFVFVPSDIIVRSSSTEDFNSGVDYLLRPQFLELTTAQCLAIYKNDSLAISDFLAGYITDLYGENKRVSPTDERRWLQSDTAWKIYGGLQPAQLTVSCQALYALAADIPDLIESQSMRDLKIPQIAITQILSLGYIRIDRAVDLLRLTHPECTANHLLQLKQLNQMDFVTLPPSGIEIRQSVHHGEEDDPENRLVMLNIDKETCQTIQNCGEVHVDRFPISGRALYSTYDSNGKFGEIIEYFSTYYQGKLHPIKVSADCLFTQKNQVLELLERPIYFWDRVTSALSEKSALNNARNPKLQNGNGPSSPESQPGEVLLNSKELRSRLKISKGKLDYSINPGHKLYDPDFPKPIKRGGGHRQWKESEIDAYQRLLTGH